MYHIPVNRIMEEAMAECSQGLWLLLIYQIPPKPAYLRVKVWRRLQSLGAVAIKNTVYVIPKTDDTIEDFQWVAREIVENGGEATICAASFIEGLSDEQVEALFRAARDADYGRFADDARELLNSVPKRTPKPRGEYHSAFEADLNRLRKRLAIITAIDFFGAPGRSVADAVMLQLESRLGQTGSVRSRPSKDERLTVADFAGRTWITRKGIYVDRIASAWLIQRFIDPNARVCFVSDKTYKRRPGDVRFDMFGGDFTHQGDLCSFEVLARRFFPEDCALEEIGRIVHDLDLKDGKFRKPETAGVGSLIEGVALAHKTDEDRLEAGRVVFDHLYTSLNHN
jgi:hypothetical protein